jgi:N-acetyl-gamma-glutamyl-phosphate reductase
MHKEKTTLNKKKEVKITCSIVGARGYAGLELVRLLLQHPYVDLTFCYATSEFKLTDHFQSELAAKVVCLPDSEILNNLTDVVFLATPAEVSLRLAPLILARGKKVIDLSGAFRLKKHDYHKWYGFEHSESVILQSSQYGLSPWVGPTKSESLVANPGCFATAVLTALIPILKNNLIAVDSIVIDAKSGTTGGGKKAAENLLYSEVSEECLPYKVGRHQHYPEILEAIEMYSGAKIEAHFTTSLLPVRRGIIAGIYARLNKGYSISDVEEAFVQAYSDYSLVQFADVKKNASLLSLKKVVGTARTHISFEVQGDRLYLFSCIDNLLKGAASQAVENLNRISDWPLTTGVSRLEALI